MEKIKRQLTHKHVNKLIILVFLFSIVFTTVNTVSADSSIIYVNDSGGNDDWDGQYAEWIINTLSGPKKSIKNATGTVDVGGTVNIADGYYSGENNTNITIDKNMTITGQSRDNSIIDGTSSSQIFMIQNNTVKIRNLTFVNGNATSNMTYQNENVTYGGAIFNNGTLTVENSTFTNNNAIYGGAILNGGYLTIRGSIFTNNTASGATILTIGGGAIFNLGDLSVSDSSFTNNSAVGTNKNATGGGAILNYGNLAINNSIFTNNTVNYGTTNYGGAILNYGNSIVENSAFENNTANFGGVIYNYGSFNATECTFTGNTANSTVDYDGNGGAICNIGDLTVRGGSFTGNTAIKSATSTTGDITGGGAIFNYEKLTVTGSNFKNNTAINGGAICNYGDLAVNGGIFTGNTASSTNEEAFGGGAITNLGTLSVGNNSIFTYNTAIYGGAISNGYDCLLNVSSSIFAGNNATQGGAIYNYGNSTVNNSTFTNNIASTTDLYLAYDGGAISNDGALFVTNSTFTGNIADFGGAISNQPGSTVTVLGSTLNGNSATVDGSAIYSAGKLTVRYCRLVSNYITGYAPEDVYNSGGTADVRYNWWGSNAGPAAGRVVGATVSPWLVLTVTASQYVIKAGGTSIITADLLHDNLGVYHSPTTGHVPDGIPVSFTTTLGTVDSLSSTVNGIAKSTLKCGSVGGLAYVSSKVDNQIVQIPPRIITTSPKNSATGVSRTATIYIKFSGNIKASINWSKIIVKDKYGKTVSITKWISGNMLYIKTNSKRSSYSYYTVYIPASAVKDYSGNNLITGYTFRFKTGRY